MNLARNSRLKMGAPPAFPRVVAGVWREFEVPWRRLFQNLSESAYSMPLPLIEQRYRTQGGVLRQSLEGRKRKKIVFWETNPRRR
jgi:hypothetical protein